MSDLTAFSDEELAEHLANLHAAQAELLEAIGAASREVERRAEAAQARDVMASLTASLRERLSRDLKASSPLHASIQAALASAEGGPTEEGQG